MKNLEHSPVCMLHLVDGPQPQFCSSPLIGQQLNQFSHDVVDLLRHSPQCRLPFGRFIPAYHHHFGRQCRVAEYGYNKLIDLLDAIPHVVQVLQLVVRTVDFFAYGWRSKYKQILYAQIG